MKDLLEAYRERYSVKLFSGPISEEELSKVLEAIRLSPSSFNFQPWFIYVLKGGAVKKATPLAHNQRNVATASHLLVFAGIFDRERLLRELYEVSLPHYGEEKAKARMDYLKNFLYSLSEEEFHEYVSNQVFIALGFALSAAAFYSIGSCAIGGFEPEGIKELVGMPPEEEPVVLLALGRPADKPRPKMRKERPWRVIEKL